MDYKDEIEHQPEKYSQNVNDIKIEYGRNDKNAGNLLDKTTEDVAYRYKLFHTVCICISMFALGWRNALIGPTFPDLRLITAEDLATASWIFTAKSLGGLIGSVCGGFAYDRYNKIAVFVSTVLGMGVVAVITPWCFHFAAMLILHVFHGVFASAIDTSATADMAIVWKQKAGPFMQAVHFAFSAGAIVSPLISEPFLAEKNILNSQHASEHSNFSVVTDMEIISPTNAPLGFGINTTQTEYGKTRIYVPYSITSIVCFVSACLYFFTYRFYGNIYRESTNETSEWKIHLSQKQFSLGKTMKVILTVLLALVLLLYVVGEHCFIGFLMTFVISKLKWSKANGSTASSAFWISFAIGRLSGIFIVKFVNISKMIVIFSSLLTAGDVLFLLAVMFDENILVWLSVIVIGYGMSTIFGLVFSWLSQNVRTLTGKMTSIFFVFMCIGNMAIPILVGYLMDKISQMWFIYLLLILSVAMLVTFIFALVLFNLLMNVHNKCNTTKSMLTVKDTEC